MQVILDARTRSTSVTAVVLNADSANVRRWHSISQTLKNTSLKGLL